MTTSTSRIIAARGVEVVDFTNEHGARHQIQIPLDHPLDQRQSEIDAGTMLLDDLAAKVSARAKATGSPIA